MRLGLSLAFSETYRIRRRAGVAAAGVAATIEAVLPPRADDDRHGSRRRRRRCSSRGRLQQARAVEAAEAETSEPAAAGLALASRNEKEEEKSDRTRDRKVGDVLVEHDVDEAFDEKDLFCFVFRMFYGRRECEEQERAGRRLCSVLKLLRSDQPGRCSESSVVEERIITWPVF